MSYEWNWAKVVSNDFDGTEFLRLDKAVDFYVEKFGATTNSDTAFYLWDEHNTRWVEIAAFELVELGWVKWVPTHRLACCYAEVNDELR